MQLLSMRHLVEGTVYSNLARLSHTLDFITVGNAYDYGYKAVQYSKNLANLK